MRNASQKCHGTAFRTFVRKLIALSDGRARVIDQAVEFFRNKALRSDDGDIIGDVVGKFALLYAAGRLAIRFGIVPWTKSQLCDALITSLEAAKLHIPNDRKTLDNGKRLLREKLDNLPSKTDWNANHCGFKSKRPSVNFLVQCEAFNATFESAHQQSLVRDWLKQTRRIELSKGGTATSRQPKSQFPWPDGKRRRSYRIFAKANG